MSGPTADLLPCPCCAGSAKLHWSRHSGLFWIDCVMCRVGTSVEETIDEVVVIWNRRTNRTTETISPPSKGSNGIGEECTHTWIWLPDNARFCCSTCGRSRAAESEA